MPPSRRSCSRSIAALYGQGLALSCVEAQLIIFIEQWAVFIEGSPRLFD